VLDTIAALVDHSLVQSVESDLDDPRWTMLQTIQEFGIDAFAASGEIHDLRRAHAEVYAQMAANAEIAFYGKSQADWLKRLTSEESNIRAALEWSLDNGERELALQIAGSIWRFWSLRHAGNEGRAWLAQALEMPGEVSRFVLGIGYRGAGCLAEDIGDYATADHAHRQALAIWEELGDQPRIARSIDDLGNIAHDQGDFPRAFELHRQATEVARAAGDRRAMAASHANLGSAYFLQGDIAAARDEWQGVLDSNTVDDPVSRAMVMNNLAVAFMHLDDLDGAAAILQEALGIHEELGTLATRADVYINLSEVEVQRGDRARARVYFEQSLELYRLAEDPKGLHNAYFSLGVEQVQSGEPHAALRSFRECVQYADRANNRLGVAEGIERIASLALGTALAVEAAQLAGAAKGMRDKAGAKGIPAIQQFVTELHADFERELEVSGFQQALAHSRDLTPRQAAVRAHDLAERLAEMSLPKRAQSTTELAPAPSNPFRLTKREIEVLRLLAEGRTDRDIAAALFISPRTAGSHVTNLFAKMKVDSRASAVATGFRNQLI
jgi:non-specific serine/threonine protein kinase